jgi:RecB family exonuclease
MDEIDDGIVPYEWGAVRVHHHTQMPPDDEIIMRERSRLTTWDRLRLGDSLAGEPVSPPLLETVAVDRTAAARHLSVTQIADLGAQAFNSFYAERFRRQVLQDAPARISPAVYNRQLGRIIGEMVHEALRWWQPGQESLEDLLESYAWEQGIVDESQRQMAVAQAQRYLNQFHQSRLYREITASSRVYRELPFIFDNGKRIIHGVIDVLFQQPDGTWTLVDYKTSDLRGEAAKSHAQRFHMQVGAYAGAVLEQLQLVDDSHLAVYIHYIRHDMTVRIESDEWRTAMEKMEPAIGSLVGK